MTRVWKLGRARVTAATVAGAAAAAAAAFAGPRIAVAVALGLAVAGSIIVVAWLRARLRLLGQQVSSMSATTVTQRDIAALGRRVRAAARTNFVQLEALHNLHAMLPIRHRMPATRYQCAAAPDLLLLLVSLVQQRRPTTIIELGSGASTLWMALALREFDVGGRVVSVDHDRKYAGVSQERLHTLGLEKYAEVRHAPLVDLELGDEVFPWYDRAVFDDVSSCDLLLVDGPPGRIRRMSRYPALPVFGPRMCLGSTVVVDDYRRSPEREMVDRWMKDSPGWTLDEAPLEKGAALLTRGQVGS